MCAHGTGPPRASRLGGAHVPLLSLVHPPPPLHTRTHTTHTHTRTHTPTHTPLAACIHSFTNPGIASTHSQASNVTQQSARASASFCCNFVNRSATYVACQMTGTRLARDPQTAVLEIAGTTLRLRGHLFSFTAPIPPTPRWWAHGPWLPSSVLR